MTNEERERERERQTDRQTDRQTETERERERKRERERREDKINKNSLFSRVIEKQWHSFFLHLARDRQTDRQRHRERAIFVGFLHIYLEQEVTS